MALEFGNGSGDDQEGSSSRKGKRNFHRHTPQQIQALEASFKECPHPDETQRKQLGRDLGLEPQQIKFWFQNKRTQTKAQNERADNTTLRVENEKIRCENHLIIEALKNVICPSCVGPSFGEEERMHNLEKLRLENAQLREEFERVSSSVSKHTGTPVSQLRSMLPIPGSPLDISLPSFPAQGMRPPSLDLGLTSRNFDNPSLTYQLTEIPEMERSLMSETAASAMEELIRLVRIDDPLWTKSSPDGKYVLNPDSYEKISPRASHIRYSNARVESSKDSCLVNMNAMYLVDMFLDSDKWADIFPTILAKARTIHVLGTGMLGNGSGSLQLMYEQMHSLSPLVAPREFYFLRCSQQIEVGVWVIADVSYDYSKETQTICPSRCWRFPSGCMIQDMPNGCSKVTWVEHVELNDTITTHWLYKDLMTSGLVFGAERWVVTLQRMLERFIYPMLDSTPDGAITLPEGRRSIMKLAHRMVKKFCAILSMEGKLDFPQLPELNNSGVRVAIRNSVEPGEPNSMIVSAATSLWLPVSPLDLFNYFRDEKNRVQWDVLSNGKLVQEIARISNGIHPGNGISFIQRNPPEDNMLILQESCIDPLGSLIVYAPIDLPSVTIAMNGQDTSEVPVLPSGFIISGDGRSDKGNSSTSTNGGRSGGSLLTVAFQIPVYDPSPCTKQLNMESVATINTLICSTLQRVKAAFNCSGMD